MLGVPTNIVGTPGKGNRDAEDAPQFGGPSTSLGIKKPVRGSGQAGATRTVEKIKIDELSGEEGRSSSRKRLVSNSENKKNETGRLQGLKPVFCFVGYVEAKAPTS
jgi:hypothetical protein